MITTEIDSSASPSTVHELLVDVDSWSVWSPHVASVDATSRRVGPGWMGTTRAFFSPAATAMFVSEVRPGGGYRWHSVAGPWRLDYDNAVDAAADDGSTIRFTAELTGPAASVVERVVAPLSALGQRRRMHRLARTAELLERQGDVGRSRPPDDA